jgi:four helix bundle protein
MTSAGSRGILKSGRSERGMRSAEREMEVASGKNFPMSFECLKERTMQFALRVLEVVDRIPTKTPKGKNIADQLCRSGTSVAANYRAAARAKSTADFISKMGIVEEEADEVLFWLELIVRSNMIPEARLQSLIQEANEILSITVASIKTAKRNK